MSERKPIEAEGEHNGEKFRLRVGERMVMIGRYEKQPHKGTVEVKVREEQGATVLGISPEDNVAFTDGKGGWHTRAQFDSMRVTKWSDDPPLDA